ncbi:hypothetical protein ONZ45_g7410 [Pleurotus djamor]|nr:hypothetical protein ONZ45_g7410 [Pleurotus djamor]
MVSLVPMSEVVNTTESFSDDHTGVPQKHVDKLTPPPGTSFWRHQRLTVFEQEYIGYQRLSLASFTWRIDAYIYVIDAVPTASFAADGGSIYVVLVHTGSAQTAPNLEASVGWPYTPLQFRFSVEVVGGEGAALLQLPPSNSGSNEGGTWKCKALIFSQLFTQPDDMLPNHGAQTYTFPAEYSDDISFLEGEQTGDIDGPHSVRWSSILSEYYDDIYKSKSFPFGSVSVFQFDSLKSYDLVCTINANETGSGNKELVHTTKITLDCEFTAPDS